jgi:hypothetical protein
MVLFAGNGQVRQVFLQLKIKNKKKKDANSCAVAKTCASLSP